MFTPIDHRWKKPNGHRTILILRLSATYHLFMLFPIEFRFVSTYVVSYRSVKTNAITSQSQHNVETFTIGTKFICTYLVIRTLY
jgi:hypothetical protein